MLGSTVIAAEQMLGSTVIAAEQMLGSTVIEEEQKRGSTVNAVTVNLTSGNSFPAYLVLLWLVPVVAAPVNLVLANFMPSIRGPNKPGHR